MQQEIKLTNESSNTVFVDDVDVSKGMYALYHNIDDLHYVDITEGGSYSLKKPSGEYYGRFNNLKALMDCYHAYTLHTIPENKRIVTEREVTIEDLKNTDHVGFVDDNGDKGHIVCIEGQLYFTAVTNKSDTSYGYAEENKFRNVKEALSIGDICGRGLKQVYRFASRKELYQWLAE